MPPPDRSLTLLNSQYLEKSFKGERLFGLITPFPQSRKISPLRLKFETSNPLVGLVGTDQTIPRAEQTTALHTLLPVGLRHTLQHRPSSDGVPYNREDGCFVDRAQYLMAVTRYSGAVTTCHVEQCPHIVTLSRQHGLGIKWMETQN